jgi:hypothetical protein
MLTKRYYQAGWITFILLSLFIAGFFVYQWNVMVKHVGPCGFMEGPCSAKKIAVSPDTLHSAQELNIDQMRFVIALGKDSLTPYLLTYEAAQLKWAVRLKLESKCLPIEHAGKLSFEENKGVKSLVFFSSGAGRKVHVILNDAYGFDYLCFDPL